MRVALRQLVEGDSQVSKHHPWRWNERQNERRLLEARFPGVLVPNEEALRHWRDDYKGLNMVWQTEVYGKGLACLCVLLSTANDVASPLPHGLHLAHLL